MKNQKENLLSEFIPVAAIEYIESLLRDTPVHVAIKGERKYSQGTFRTKSRRGRYHITVSGNLNPYAFLITFIHEIAHLKAFELHGRKIMPHGIEWKNTFINIMAPLLKNDIFPEDLLEVMQKHFRNPSAASTTDTTLVKALARYDEPVQNTFFLDELAKGQHFVWDNRVFIKDETIRKRILCYDARTRRRYLFNPVARVNTLRS